MSCEKCCLWPCDRTTKCEDGTYHIRDRLGNIRQMIEMPESVKTIIGNAIIKALESEVT